MNIKELSDLQNQCIQEEIPHCQIDCPLHIDVRVLVQHVQSGNFKSAWKGYHKQVKFPGIVSRTCQQPCRGSCKRKEVGRGHLHPFVGTGLRRLRIFRKTVTLCHFQEE